MTVGSFSHTDAGFVESCLSRQCQPKMTDIFQDTAKVTRPIQRAVTSSARSWCFIDSARSLSHQEGLVLLRKCTFNGAVVLRLRFGSPPLPPCLDWSASVGLGVSVTNIISRQVYVLRSGTCHCMGDIFTASIIAAAFYIFETQGRKFSYLRFFALDFQKIGSNSHTTKAFRSSKKLATVACTH